MLLGGSADVSWCLAMETGARGAFCRVISPHELPLPPSSWGSYGTFVKILGPCGHKKPTGVLIDLTKVISTPNIPLEVLGMVC